MKSLQQAVVEAQVILPMFLITALTCFLLVPLTQPTSCLEGWLVGYEEEALDLAAQLKHRAQGKVTDGDSEVQAACSARARGTGTVAEYVGLRPVPVTDRTRTYLGVHRTGGDGTIFSMPSEIP